MLTRDRPAMARQAVACFRAQTYPAKRLLVVDSGRELYPGIEDESSGVCWEPCHEGFTIGELRNTAVNFLTEFPIIVHWDDDDWSHPNRIAEQVALLQWSGADVVGYREMLFARQVFSPITDAPTDSEAWLYNNPNPGYALGTSLCYWRETWERKPFEATSRGEDLKFCLGLKVAGVPSIGTDGVPRMIARIHSANTSTAYTSRKMVAPEWRRVPEWDKHCAVVFA